MQSLDPIRAIIVDDSRLEKCEGRCGHDFGNPDVLSSSAELLHSLYGERVSLEFFDLAEPASKDLPAEIQRKLHERSLTLPALFVNGNVRVSGMLDPGLIQRVIQAEIELFL